MKNRMNMTKDINRLKVVLAEKKKTNRWLANQLGKDEGTVSKWCTNLTILQYVNFINDKPIGRIKYALN